MTWEQAERALNEGHVKEVIFGRCGIYESAIFCAVEQSEAVERLREKKLYHLSDPLRETSKEILKSSAEAGYIWSRAKWRN